MKTIENLNVYMCGFFFNMYEFEHYGGYVYV